MKGTFLIAALATAVAAQSIADLPSCSLVCLSTAIAGLGCGLTDNACSCKQAAKLTPSVTPCVQKSCTDPADQKKTIDVLAGICAAAGFPIEAPAAPSAAPAAPAAPAPEEKSTPAQAPSQAPSQAPVEKPSATEAEYPAYPATTEATSEAPASSPLTPDASSICSGAVTETVTVTHPSPRPTSAPAVLPPYPTGTLAPSVPAPSGTGVSSYTPVPEFTGAAAAMNVPVVAAGMLGLAAFVF